TVAEGFEFHSNLDSFRQRSDIDKRHLRSAVADRRGSDLVSEHLRDQPEQNAYRLRKDEESKAHAFLAGLPTKKALLLAHEIFGPPKSMEE
ncbi:MAG: hypothetical protein KDK78_12180, partial [Chlamydiia bacterium]|nr:hypothetical protein [Chlamydiia bacterium]